MTSLKKIKQQSTAYLYRRRTVLAHKAAPLIATIIQGRLVETYRSCSKSHCLCRSRRGRGHGPTYYLSVSRAGRYTQRQYVPQYYKPQVDQCLTNSVKVSEILEMISNINREILRRRKTL